jgi:hypothetical protein
MASQLLITNQNKVLTTWFLDLPLDKYIDNITTQSLNFKSNTTWSTTKRPKAKESSRRSSRRRKNHQTTHGTKERAQTQNSP